MTQEDIQKDTEQTTIEDQEVTTETSIEEMTTEEIRAEAEALEAAEKAAGKGKKDEEIRADQTRRLEKARERAAGKQPQPHDKKPDAKPLQTELPADDIVTLRMKNFAKDSDEAQVLKRYKDAGIIKDYESGLEHVGVKAELEAITAKRNARNVVDENDRSGAGFTNSKKDIINRYQATGEIPNDPRAREIIVENNLKSKGFES